MTAPHSPRRAIFAILCYCMATGSVLIVGPATCLSAMAAELDMALDAEKGIFLGAPFWGLGLVALLSGWLTQRLGYRLLLLASVLVQTAGLLLIATAAAQTQAMAGSVLLGLGRGAIVAPMLALLCSIYPEDRTTVANIFHAFFHIGMAAAIGLVLALFAAAWGWREIFLVFAALVAPCGLVGFAVVLPRPVRTADGSDSLRRIAGQAGFALLVVGIFFGGMIETGPTSWLPYFVEQAVGTSRSFGAVGLLCFALTMGCGRLLVPGLVRRWGAKKVLAVSGSLSAVSVVMAALPLGTAFAVLWLAVLGLAVSSIFPTMLGYAGDRFPNANASLFAVLNSSAITGSIAAPAAVGLAADHIGLRPAMALLALAALCFLAAMLRLFNTAVPRSASHA